jgi:hypothetical protein
MPTECRRLFVLCLSLWVLPAFGLLYATGPRALETYFLIGFVGLLIAMQVAAPTDGRPGWWRILRRVEIACFLLFVYVVYGRVTVML